jgi:hypothetical protein
MMSSEMPKRTTENREATQEMSKVIADHVLSESVRPALDAASEPTSSKE